MRRPRQIDLVARDQVAARGQVAARRAPPGSLRELEIRAAALAGRSVGELSRALGVTVPGDDARRSKGFIGQLAEAALGADPEAGERPDFLGLGVELKTIPVDRRGMPAESTFCCSVRMADADRARWETSRLRQRLARVLWLPVEAARYAALGQRRFGQARLWSPDEAEMALLRADWEELMGLVGAGDAAAITAHRGSVVQLRPKAAHGRVRTLAPGDDGPAMTLPLGFYMRARATAAILAQGRLPGPQYPQPLRDPNET